MIKKITYTMILLALLVSGCASQYSNKQLVDLFDEKGFRTVETDRGVVVFLSEVYFEFDSSQLTDIAQEKLSALSAILIDPRVLDRHILVEGHTDSIGDNAYNMSLSLNRAEAAGDALVMNGVQDDRVTRRGYGHKYPIAPNTNDDGRDYPEGRAMNRRVEIIVVKNK